MVLLFILYIIHLTLLLLTYYPVILNTSVTDIESYFKWTEKHINIIERRITVDT